MKNEVKSMKQDQQAGLRSDPGSLLLIVYSLIIILFLLIGTFSQAYAYAAAEQVETVGFDDVKNGELLIAVEKADGFVKAPLLSQKVDLRVSGMVVSARVEQLFRNNSDRWIEAVYAFPLPDESAVQQMRMVLGERVIVGRIQEKQQARETYERAKREGKKTSLLAQKRPNIFTMAVANIPPQSTIEVEIEYVDMVRFDGGIFSLRFPMVVGPRYIPGAPVERQRKISFDEGGWAADTDQVDDASQITPPVAAPDEPALNPVELSIDLSPGFPVQGLASLYHGVEINEKSDHGYQLTFNGKVFADRDFVLEYGAANKHAVAAALFSEKKDGKTYHLVMLMPPVEKEKSQVPREIIFVLDISGSMAGSSIRQAKSAMQHAIARLGEQDRFNVIVFNNRAKKIFPSPIAGSPINKQKTLGIIDSLTADGGTEIAPALKLALDGRDDHRRIRQIVFLTDGAVGNEQALFSLIADNLGDSRLFTVGIGSAPNSYFMTRAAAMGRGSFSFIGKVDEVNGKMRTLFEKLEHPVISDLSIDIAGGVKARMYPDPLPDLYSGEPVVGLIRCEHDNSEIKLSGTNMGRRWEVKIDSSSGLERQGIATLWARKKIRSLMQSLHLGAAQQEVRRQVVNTAIAHHLVTKYTSLVAVEQEVSRPVSETLAAGQVKTNLPKGWQHGKVFGGRARTATPSPLLILSGAILLFLSYILLRRRRV